MGKGGGREGRGMVEKIIYLFIYLYLSRVGFVDPRLVEQSPVTVDNKNIESRAGNLKFFSATYRLFKLSGLEAGSEVWISPPPPPFFLFFFFVIFLFYVISFCFILFHFISF